jgi:D-arabinose 1-dehydrogenase-like Zn-dependent alcohol dehydrogenase
MPEPMLLARITATAAVVRIEASGLRHADIHAAHGDWPVKPTTPFIPGHEGVGYVEKLGTGESMNSRPARSTMIVRAFRSHCQGGRRARRHSPSARAHRFESGVEATRVTFGSVGGTFASAWRMSRREGW